MDTELITIEAARNQLAAFAAEVTDVLGAAKIKYVGTKSGIFKVDGNKVAGNRLICIVLAFTRVNALYMSGYVEGTMSTPSCFAMALKKSDLKPHETVIDKRAVSCDACKYNVMKSAALLPHKAALGRTEGKACKNDIRLALLPIGYVDKKNEVVLDGSNIMEEELLFMNVPPTSGFGFEKYARKIATDIKDPLPTFGVVTSISTETHDTKSWEMLFTRLTMAKSPEGELKKIDIGNSPLLPQILSRKAEAEVLVMTPYPPEKAGEANTGVPAEPVNAADLDTDDF